jgi:hypothetical protein
MFRLIESDLPADQVRRIDSVLRIPLHTAGFRYAVGCGAQPEYGLVIAMGVRASTSAVWGKRGPFCVVARASPADWLQDGC